MGYHNAYEDFGSKDYCDPVPTHQRNWISRADQRKTVLKYRNVFVYTEKDMVRFDRKWVNRPFLTIKNLIDLDEYFPKFLKIAKKAIKRIPDMQSAIYVNEQMTYEYKKDLSQDTIRAIIDCRTMNPQTKLAAILSVLKWFPASPFKEIEAIVTRLPYFEVSFGKQWLKPAPATADFGILDTILLPNFISSENEYCYVPGLDFFKTDPDFLRELWKQYSFMSLNTNVRYEDWLNSSNDDVIYKPKQFGKRSELIDSINSIAKRPNDKLSKKLYDLTPYEMRLFHFLFPAYTESVTDFLKSQMRTKDIYYVKNSYLWDDDGFSDYESDLEEFARTMTTSQWNALESDFYKDNDSELRDDVNSLSFLGATVAVYCYVNYGFSKLKEFMEIVASHPRKYGLCNARPSYDTPANAMENQGMFIKALDREYGDMPLCWAVNLLNESTDSEKAIINV